MGYCGYQLTFAMIIFYLLSFYSIGSNKIVWVYFILFSFSRVSEINCSSEHQSWVSFVIVMEKLAVVTETLHRRHDFSLENFHEKHGEVSWLFEFEIKRKIFTSTKKYLAHLGRIPRRYPRLTWVWACGRWSSSCRAAAGWRWARARPGWAPHPAPSGCRSQTGGPAAD